MVSCRQLNTLCDAHFDGNQKRGKVAGMCLNSGEPASWKCVGLGFYVFKASFISYLTYRQLSYGDK